MNIQWDKIGRKVLFSTVKYFQCDHAFGNIEVCYDINKCEKEITKLCIQVRESKKTKKKRLKYTKIIIIKRRKNIQQKRPANFVLNFCDCVRVC